MRSNNILNNHYSIADLNPRKLNQLEKEVDALWLNKSFGSSNDELITSLQKKALQKKKSWFPTVAAVLGPLGLLGTAGGWAALRHSEKDAATAAKQSKRDKYYNALMRQLDESEATGKPLIDVKEFDSDTPGGPNSVDIRTIRRQGGRRGAITSSLITSDVTDGLLDALRNSAIIHKWEDIVDRS